MIRVSWINTGTTYRRMEGDICNIDTIPFGVYEVDLSITGWSLTKIADKFTFNYKLYDIQNDFLKYITKTYNSTNGNLGVLMSGTRGSGKSVSSKLLANSLELPIIIVKSMGDKNEEMFSYLASFNFDCLFFFDEFEKQFNEHDSTILQFMDGIYTSEYRRVFLLTTNHLTVNENLLSRPSRIRYVRQFGNLDKNIVDEYLEDNLNDKTNKTLLLDYIDTLTISTIDILKSIVEEANIHGVETFLEMKNSFNVQTAKYHYNLSYGCAPKDTVVKRNFTIETFLKEKKSWDNRFVLRDKRDSELAAATSDEEKRIIKEKYSNIENRIASYYTTTIERDKPWYKFIPGKDTIRDSEVVKIDIKNNVVVCYDKDDDYFYYFLVENPNQKPSLYNNNISEYYKGIVF